MANITDICNMALAFLSKGRIASLDDETEPARQCKLFYDVTRQHLLRDYSWGFAKRVSKLAELDDSNPYWEHVYVYPNKCLNVRKIFTVGEYVNEKGLVRNHIIDNPGNDDRTKWDVCMMSDNIVAIGCDVPNAWVEYTYDANNAEVFTPDFVEALAHMLAFNICAQLTGNYALQQQQYQLAQAVLQRAKYTTAAEKTEILEYPNKYFLGRG